MNWIDLVIFFVLLLTAIQGWFSGFVLIGVSLFSLVGSYLMSMWLENPVGSFLSEKFGLVSGWANVLAFVVIGTFSQQLLSFLGHIGVYYLPKKIVSSKTNNLLGVLISMINGGVITAFVLTFIMILPLKGTIQSDIEESFVGSRFVQLVRTYGGGLTSLMDEASTGARRFLTVKPATNETVPLDSIPEGAAYTSNTDDEFKMYRLVNAERLKAGVGALEQSDFLTEIARAYGKDMVNRRFFSHQSPEGEVASDRLNKAKIRFGIVGENLAYAPNVTIAMNGLMESEGHRRNIVESEFTVIGIGVIDVGAFGKIFVQVFTD